MSLTLTRPILEFSPGKSGMSDTSIPHREYIPFMSSFEGRVEAISPSPFSRHRTYLLRHLNQPLGRIEVHPDGSLNCQIPHNGEWVHEFSSTKGSSHSYPQSFGEFWGLNNFAVCRLLPPENIPQEALLMGYEDPKTVAWVELRHSPTLPLSRKLQSASHALVHTSTTWVPLRTEQCELLMRGLYTVRLSVQWTGIPNWVGGACHRS